MAIRVKITDTFGGHFVDALSGIELDSSTTTSGDLTGLDCRNVIRELIEGELELLEGTLDPVVQEGTIVAGNTQYDALTIANRLITHIAIRNRGAGDIRLSWNDMTLGVKVAANEAFTYSLDVPAEIITITYVSGGATDYEMVVK